MPRGRSEERRAATGGRRGSGWAGREWSRFLVEVIPLLNTSLEYETTLEDLARLTVPTLADCCVVDMREPDGSIRRLAAAHAEPAKEALVWPLTHHHPIGPGDREGPARAIREGHAQLFAGAPAGLLPRIAEDAEHERLLRTLGFGSGMILPLTARGRTLGALTLIRDEREQPYGETELGLAGELAALCALAVDNARLFGQVRESERQADESLALFDVFFSQAPIGLALTDPELRHLRVNRALAEMNGIPREADVGRRLDELLPQVGQIDADTARRVLRTGEPQVGLEVSGEMPAAAGRRRHWLTSYYPVRDFVGRTLGLGVIVRETTESREAEERIRLSEERFRALVDAAPDAILGVDAAGRIALANARAAAMFGYEPDELAGMPIDRLVPDRRREAHEELRHGWADAPASRAMGEGLDLLALRKDGTEFPVEISLGAVPGHGELTVTAIVADVTVRKSLEEQILHQALHDPLTNLPNRRLLLDRLEHALSVGRRAGSHVAVLLADLDDFKTVNDSLGHEAGDELLITLAERMLAAARESDTVARLGGDEFVVVCEGVSGETEALALAERLSAAWEPPFIVGSREVYATASVGIALSRPDDDPATLLRQADAAMYRGKRRGRGGYELYDERLRTRALRRLRAESELRGALERGELELAYQPILEAATSRTVDVEALLRWRHPEHGMVSPADFIPVAEDTGLIVPIGRWVLEQACTEIAHWRGAAVPPGAIGLCVNLSSRQLAGSDLLADVQAALRASGLAPTSLGLEITESVLLDDQVDLDALRALQRLGVEILLDDFGTGYSSLSYLQRLPFDTLKVDRSFVARLGECEDSSAIVTAIVTMAKALGMSVVAEGVETAEQLGRLRDLGCDRVQGYHFSPALPAADARRFAARPPD